MRHAGAAALVLLVAGLAAAQVIPSAALGVKGWRNDGTGKYPNANPPLSWGRHAKTVLDLSAIAHRPKEGELPAKEDSIADGEIRRWLLLGPIDVAEGRKPDEVLPGADALSPDAGETTAGLKWREVTTDTGCVDLAALFGKEPLEKGYAGCACAWVYSPSDRSVGMNHMFTGQGAEFVWLNGAQVYKSGTVDIPPCARLELELKKGWNRLVVLVLRTQAARKTCWFTVGLYGQSDAEYESHGIAWSTQTPSWGASAPVIAGDRIFVTCEAGAVACYNKSDGKPLWVHTVTWWDFATPEERAAHPEIFKDLDPAAARLKEIDAADLAAPPAYAERQKLEAKIAKGMTSIDKERYGNPSTYGCEAGYACCTPVTDGKLVWVLFGNGVLACFDLDGNRQWVRLIKHTATEHGYTTSPLLVDGKIVVYFEHFTVMDAKTGAVLVERPFFYARPGAHDWYSRFHGTGAVLEAGKEKVIYYLNGEFVRLSDGKTLSFDPSVLAALGPEKWTDYWANRLATPVVEGGVAYKIVDRRGVVVAFKLPPIEGDKVAPEVVGRASFDVEGLAHFYGPSYCSSPLYHEGLLYCVNDFGWLTVVDMAKGRSTGSGPELRRGGEVAYQKLLDTEVFMPYNGGGVMKGGVQSSPTLAGKHIYVWGNQGTCIVFEPGRAFKQVAKNRLENFLPGWQAHQEATMTEPVFDGDRIYYRGERVLYCIGERKP